MVGILTKTELFGLLQSRFYYRQTDYLSTTNTLQALQKIMYTKIYSMNLTTHLNKYYYYFDRM